MFGPLEGLYRVTSRSERGHNLSWTYCELQEVMVSHHEMEQKPEKEVGYGV